MKCVIDQRREADRPLVCDPCRRGLASDLRELVDAYAVLSFTEPAEVLDAGPVRAPNGSARVSGSREAPVPVSLDLVDLTLPAGPGGIYDPLGDLLQDQIGLLPVATVLDQWVRDWIDTRGRGEHLPVPTVVTLADWLGKRLDWACDEHPAVDDFAGEVRSLLRACRRMAGEASDLKKLGPCPELRDNGPACGQMLYVHPYADIIECRRCERRWDRRKQEWLWLGQLLGFDQEAA